MKAEKKKNPIYGNWRFYHPEGSFMFYSDQRRAEWYLSKGLAVKTGDKEIKLTFSPKGYGAPFDLYGSSSKDNVCVVCGLKEGDLTRHHVVPKCYRRFFPEEYKSNNSHDVVAICDSHHIEYEEEAQALKAKLDVQYEEITIQQINKLDLTFMTAKKFLYCLMDRDKYNKIPKSRLDFMQSEVKQALNISELPQNLNTLYNSIKIGRKNTNLKYGKIIVSKLDSIQDFVEMWRSHFIKTMKPKFMPAGWELHRDARQASHKTLDK